MLILIILFIPVIIGLLLIWRSRGPKAPILLIFSFVFLFVALILMPVNRMEAHFRIAEYEAVKETASIMHGRGQDIESALFQLKVVEMNQWREKANHWRGTPFRLWWPKDVERLEPIEPFF